MSARREVVTSFLLFLGVAGGLAGLGLVLRLAVGSPPAAAQAVPAGGDAAFHLDPADPQLGRRAYAFCQGCHQPDGAGIAGTYPPLAGHPRVLGPAGDLIRVTLHGYDARSGLWNGAMPGFAERLADHELAGALSWIRGQWGNQASAVTSAEVAAVRRAEAARTRAWTPAELAHPGSP